MLFDRFKVADLNPAEARASRSFNVDWTKEPKESFKELCRQRAEQIRDTYDYVIVYFSGGSDSTTVMNAFLDNGIKIDEVVTIRYKFIHDTCLEGKIAADYLVAKNYQGFHNRITLDFEKVKSFLSNDKALSESPYFNGFLHGMARFNLNVLEQRGFIPSKNKARKHLSFIWWRRSYHHNQGE